MGRLLFGTGGIPNSSALRSTVSGIERIRELGLDCMEVEFVQGVSMGEVTARLVARVAGEKGIKLSVHAPYFINLNTPDIQTAKASQKRLLQAARIGALCGARSIVFHPAFYLNSTPEETYRVVKERLQDVLSQLKTEGSHVCLRLEVTGKPTQFGTVAEIVALCLELKGIAPCIDIAHWHARTGECNTYDDMAKTLTYIGEKLGKEALADMHIHFSGIAYGKRGEIKHLPLKESDLKYVELLRALRDKGVAGMVICESPNLEDDALLLKETYEGLPKG